MILRVGLAIGLTMGLSSAVTLAQQAGVGAQPLTAMPYSPSLDLTSPG